jgi:hypothetical protein
MVDMPDQSVFRRFAKMMRERNAPLTGTPCGICGGRLYLKSACLLETTVFLLCDCSACSKESVVCFDSVHTLEGGFPDVYFMVQESVVPPERAKEAGHIY